MCSRSSMHSSSQLQWWCWSLALHKNGPRFSQLNFVRREIQIQVPSFPIYLIGCFRYGFSDATWDATWYATSFEVASEVAAEIEVACQITVRTMIWHATSCPTARPNFSYPISIGRCSCRGLREKVRDSSWRQVGLQVKPQKPHMKHPNGSRRGNVNYSQNWVQLYFSFILW
jgi:hypothetical protein